MEWFCSLGWWHFFYYQRHIWWNRRSYNRGWLGILFYYHTAERERDREPAIELHWEEKEEKKKDTQRLSFPFSLWVLKLIIPCIMFFFTVATTTTTDHEPQLYLVFSYHYNIYIPLYYHKGLLFYVQSRIYVHLHVTLGSPSIHQSSVSVAYMYVCSGTD